ncbi:MAG: hypothetical protein E4H13_05195 [Calditrichales bacterium]|nr:MAG: hypothetical protein E4H13_05195 [Calditrichales bacterium]
MKWQRKVNMLSIRCIHVILFAALAGNVYGGEEHLWQPVADAVYLQEAGEKVRTEKPVTSLAVFDNQCYAVMDGRIFNLRDNNLNVLKAAPEDVKRLISCDQALWALSGDGLYRYQAGSWKKLDKRLFVDLCMHRGVLHGATSEEIYRLEGDKFVSIKPEGGYLSSDLTVIMADGTQILAEPLQIGPIGRLTSYHETIYILRPRTLVSLNDRVVNEYFIDWGRLPSRHTRDLLSMGSQLFISTDRGLARLRGAAMTILTGDDGLPFENTTVLRKGFADDMWIGTTRGAVRMTGGEWHYFGAEHWLPGDNVHDIAVGKQSVFIGTDAGIGIISYEPYTLQKKASFYERHIKEWGHQRLGFVHSLRWDGKEWIREISDNDGMHTGMYLAAMSYKYAVTGDETARAEAVEAFKAMRWLDEITPKDGFIARAIWSATGDKDGLAKEGSGGLPAKWYPTKDGKWYWKGDTSSDEVISHFYAVSLFHDLAARGKEKEMAARHLQNITSHIIDNGYVMRDMDDKPTRWGRWDPDYLLRPYGAWDRGLNGLEAQTFMLTALAVSNGDKKYQEAYDQLLAWGYHTYTERQKRTFPPSEIAPWDDNLAFLSYEPIMRYCKDADMRALYLRSLARSWEVKRMEHTAWFNFTYAAASGNDAELEKAVQALREWTLDCRQWTYQNSFRTDLKPAAGDVPYEGGTTRALSPRETSVMRGSRNAYSYDGGAGGRVVTEPADFLRDYWMGRFHGFIKAPAITDPDLISVKPRTGQKFGAPPYDGAPRPDIN